MGIEGPPGLGFWGCESGTLEAHAGRIGTAVSIASA